MESKTKAKEGLEKFSKQNNIVEEEFYSFNEAEYDKLVDELRPWRAE